jgi:hypothetical protein
MMAKTQSRIEGGVSKLVCEKWGRKVEGCKQTRERKTLDETKSYARQGEGDESSWSHGFEKTKTLVLVLQI